MVAETQFGDVTRRLAEILEAQADRLPVEAYRFGKRLVERLDAPVRIAILGLPGAGKSSILNFLAGKSIVPDDANFPTLELTYGETTSSMLVLADGSTETLDGLPGADIAEREPMFLRIEADLPILKKLSFLEVVADDDAEEQSRAMAWAARRSDLAIWCTTKFEERERALWDLVPDRLKDHGFLAFTKVDLVPEDGEPAPLTPDVEALFYGTFGIATEDALKARSHSGVMDEDLYTASGGRALFSAIRRDVSRGRRADLDNALMLLARFGEGGSTARSVPFEVAPTAGGPSVEAVPVVHPLSDAEMRSVRKALDDLRRRATRLTPDLSAEEILGECLATADHLAELLSEQDQEGPAFGRLQDEWLDAAELMQLLQMESESTRSAADAVSLLLQMRRELESSCPKPACVSP